MATRTTLPRRKRTVAPRRVRTAAAVGAAAARAVDRVLSSEEALALLLRAARCGCSLDPARASALDAGATSVG